MKGFFKLIDYGAMTFPFMTVVLESILPSRTSAPSMWADSMVIVKSAPTVADTGMVKLSSTDVFILGSTVVLVSLNPLPSIFTDTWVSLKKELLVMIRNDAFAPGFTVRPFTDANST